MLFSHSVLVQSHNKVRFFLFMCTFNKSYCYRLWFYQIQCSAHILKTHLAGFLCDADSESAFNMLALSLLQPSWVTGLRSGPCARPYGADWATEIRSQMWRPPASTSSSSRGDAPSPLGCTAEPPAGWRRRRRWQGRVATWMPSSATWRATASARRVDLHRRRVRQTEAEVEHVSN